MGISSGTGAVGFMPVGVVVPFAGSSSPAGWQLCYGQAISRTTYAGLFSSIGTTYGSGDGSTTFNVPELRGRVVAGEDDMGGTAASRLTAGGSGIIGTTLGATGGTQTHTLTTTEMPSHTHTQNPHSHSETNAVRYPSVTVANFGEGGGFNSQYNASTSTGSSTATNQNTGGGGAHQNTQPTIILNYIIKAA